MNTIKALVLFVTLIALVGCEWVVYEGDDDVIYVRTPVTPDYSFSPFDGPICYNADEEWWDDPYEPWEIGCIWGCAMVDGRVTGYSITWHVRMDGTWDAMPSERLFYSRCEI